MIIKDKKKKSPFKAAITAQDVADLLNEMNRLDPQATLQLIIKTNVPCNNEIANHKTIQVYADTAAGTAKLTMLGFLNGLFGINKDGYGCLAAVFDDKTGRLTEFRASDNFKTQAKIPV
jgi:hypothetical protein